jgi:CRISPR-associated protein Csm2
MSKTGQSNLDVIITDPDGAAELVRYADELGRELAQGRLTTSQIRALFGEVRQIEGQWSMGGEQEALAQRRLYLLKPKMAYRAKRERGRSVQQLVDVLDPSLDLVLEEPDPRRKAANFTRFVEFFEAILAYHKSYGGN